MRQAIVTKFLGPTDHRGSRVKATADAGSVTIPWDDRLDVNDNHRCAAVALARKFGWTGHLKGGGLPHAMGGNVYVLMDLKRLRDSLEAAQECLKSNQPAEAYELVGRVLLAGLWEGEVLP